jgi:hypothetical protein
MERQSSIHLYVPLALKERVEASARANRRSVAREIQVLLEQAVAPVPVQTQAEAR